MNVMSIVGHWAVGPSVIFHNVFSTMRVVMVWVTLMRFPCLIMRLIMRRDLAR
jgi:hypothetical protein